MVCEVKKFPEIWKSASDTVQNIIGITSQKYIIILLTLWHKENNHFFIPAKLFFPPMMSKVRKSSSIYYDTFNLMIVKKKNRLNYFWNFSHFYLKIEVKDFTRYKWIHEKISNPEVAPFHPPNPGRNQGGHILNQIRRVFCDTYLKDTLQFDLWILCARRSGLNLFVTHRA